MTRRLPHIAKALAVLAVAFLATLGAGAQDRAYVQVPGIPGESDDAAHVDWIDAWALDHAASVPGGGGPTFADVAFLKGTDKSTPRLHRKLGDTANLGTVAIEVCRVGPPQECYYRLELTDARLVSIDLAGSACIDPVTSCTPSQTESVTLDYRTITWKYTEWQNGSPVGDVIECWDTVTNTSC